jgi:tRNA threonylcarbamoyladenosine biosynthesis protein TsaB
MKLLAFDTSTDTLSIAVTRERDGLAQVWQYTGAGGAQASSTLIPTILSLMAQAGLRLDELDAVVFGRGPGSFTGLRTACSVAQGLAFGAGLNVLPLDTLLAVAEEARLQLAQPAAPCRVMALLDARMNEMYVAGYEFNAGQWTLQQDDELVQPEHLVVPPGWTLAGNAFAAYAERWPAAAAAAPRIPALPTATAMLRLAPGLLAAGQAVSPEQALPRYIRDKVARTTLERAADKAAA